MGGREGRVLGFGVLGFWVFGHLGMWVLGFWVWSFNLFGLWKYSALRAPLTQLRT